MNIERQTAVLFLVALGFKAAEEWENEKIQTKLAGVPKHLTLQRIQEDAPKMENLYNALTEAVGKEEEIVIEGGKPARKKGKKAKAEKPEKKEKPIKIDPEVAQRINDREKTIATLKKQTLACAGDALREVIAQGQDLLKIKAKAGHGRWLTWLEENCPEISARSAQDYMRLASDPKRAAELVEAGSIRRALLLADANEDGEDSSDQEGKSAKKKIQPYRKAIDRLLKLSVFIDKHPVEEWSEDGLDKFRDKLMPIAALFWPEKFKKA